MHLSRLIFKANVSSPRLTYVSAAWSARRNVHRTAFRRDDEPRAVDASPFTSEIAFFAVCVCFRRVNGARVAFVPDVARLANNSEQIPTAIGADRRAASEAAFPFPRVAARHKGNDKFR